jgi:proline dehydrogenase
MKPTQNAPLAPVASPLREGTSLFENTEVAFSGKSDNDLKRAYWLFRIIGNPTVSLIGKYATEVALALRLPINGMVKATIFKQFVGGESIAACEVPTKALDRYDIGTILDYSVEGKESESDFDYTANEILETIATAAGNHHIPFTVFKTTGLSPNKLLEKVSAGHSLIPAEVAAFERVHERVDRICRKAAETGTPVFIDAEESWLQPAIDALAREMMAKYNREKAIVYNTLQMYRHDRLDYLKEMVDRAERMSYFYGVKLVRGAYMEKERKRAEERGYPSPIQPDKDATDRDFNAALAFCLDSIARVAFCAGTHNEESSLFLAQELLRRGIAPDDMRVYAAQLFGMSDHISFNLSDAGYNVAKYVPYGPVREVMPYLIRRAQENTSVSGQTSRELALIMKEMKRRKGLANR